VARGRDAAREINQESAVAGRVGVRRRGVHRRQGPANRNEGEAGSHNRNDGGLSHCEFLLLADTDAMLMTDDDACLRPGREKSSEARGAVRSFRFRLLTCPQSKRLLPGCNLSYRPYNCFFEG